MARLVVLPVLMTGFVFGLPMASLPMGELQALNRELGQLCSKPPREALAVCRIHARLIRAF
ncbi:hypothetical protein WH7805_13588 [Synechococcus sp. WH 7805]|uniref:hypothetical protein n=2 Tax=unclassified Synechococcus TaxID=2626047 RepID=UPI00006BB293|nr:hypothetical protein WH7805_13588 [Synechococcus sp. WH 7805]